MSSIPKPAPRTDLVLLLSLYAAEFAVVLIGLSLHKLAGRPIEAWQLSGAGVALLAAIVLLSAALVLIVRAYLKHARSNARGFGFTIAMNFVTVVLILLPLETGLRWLSRKTPDTAVFADTVLLPRSWARATEHHRQVARKPSWYLSFIVYDEALGWTNGSSRQSSDGLYFSSAEGLRSAQPGAVLALSKQKLRIAVVGDSMTFAQGVKFEDSWPHLLETALGSEVEVLNFGVLGYGVDQAYLKFKKEVLAWKPDAVVLGFIEHNLHRTMTVYPFINWPDWDWPFSKPRLVLEHGGLRSLNVPATTPNEIFGVPSIRELPFVEYDQGFKQDHWEESAFDMLYVKRWLFTRFPRWSDESAQALDANRISLNRAILKEFVRTAEENRIAPLVVFFPIPSDVQRRVKGEQGSAHRALTALQVPVVDTTPCLIKAGPIGDVFLAQDSHYSTLGNAAVAQCIVTALRTKLQQHRTASVQPTS